MASALMSSRLRFCKPQVVGSSPTSGFSVPPVRRCRMWLALFGEGPCAVFALLIARQLRRCATAHPDPGYSALSRPLTMRSIPCPSSSYSTNPAAYVGSTNVTIALRMCSGRSGQALTTAARSGGLRTGGCPSSTLRKSLLLYDLRFGGTGFLNRGSQVRVLPGALCQIVA